MWLYIVFLAIGISVGFLNRIPVWVDQKSGRFQLWSLLIILFAMGTAIGSDAEVTGKFAEIGLHSLIFALSAAAGSCIMIKLLRPVIRKERDKAW